MYPVYTISIRGTTYGSKTSNINLFDTHFLSAYLSLHQRLFKGEGVMVDAPQNVTVLCFRRSHQQNTCKI